MKMRISKGGLKIWLLLVCMYAFLIIGSVCIRVCTGEEWRPTAWYEEAKTCEPVCQEIRIALIGDSLMKGKWFTEYFHDLFVQYGEYDFKEEYGPSPIVKNFARKSVGMSGIKEQVWNALYDFQPTHVVIYGGINDCMKYGHLPWENAAYVEIILDELIRKVQEAGAHPVVVEHHPWQYSRRDKMGYGYHCSVLVNEWIEAELMMSNPAWPVRTMELGSCDGMRDDGSRECRCDDVTCETRHKLESPYDAGDGLHLSRLGQGTLAHVIFDQVSWQCW